MQKDLYSAKDSNISVKEMKHQNSYNNRNQLFDSEKSSKSPMFGRKFSASEGSNAFYINYTDVSEQQIAEDFGLENVQKRISMMRLLRKPSYDLAFVLFLAFAYLGILFAAIILRDYVFNELNIFTKS